MSQLSCVHCNQPLDANASRRGNTVTCPSCKGAMYMPQVQQAKTAQSQAAAQQPVQRKAAPPIRARASSKQGCFSTTGVGVTLVILGIVIIGGGGLTVAGYLVYKATKDRLDAQEQRRKAYEIAALEEKKREEEAIPIGPMTAMEPTKGDLLAMRNTLVALDEAGKDAEEDFKEAMEDAGMDRLLAADRVAKDTDFRESRKMLADIRAVISHHRKESRIPLDHWVEDLEAIKFEGIQKEEIMRRVRAFREPYEAEMDKLWDLQLRIHDQYEQAIKHLEATRGTWKLEGDSLAFNDVKDAERYRQFFNEVDKHSQSQFDTLRKYISENELIKKIAGDVTIRIED